VYDTFTRYWFRHWPLDHVFVSDELRRLPAFGSDHFPIDIAVDHAPAARKVQSARTGCGGPCRSARPAAARGSDRGRSAGAGSI
jgi:hypothetical protein